MDKSAVINVVNQVLGVTKIHKSKLAVFCESDSDALKILEEQNPKISVVVDPRGDGEVWGVNALTIINTILLTLVDDSFYFIVDEYDFVKQVVWQSGINTGSCIQSTSDTGLDGRIL